MTSIVRACGAFLSAAFLFLTACGGGDGPTDPPPPPPTPQPGAVEIVNGPFAAQVGRDITVRVRILDTSGAQMASATVRFAPQNGGSATPAQATTGTDGIAATVWTLGGNLGTQTLQVSAGSVVEVVNATASVGDPALIATISGGGQTSALQSTLPEPLIAEVQDAFGHALADVPVTFSVPPGDGAANPSEAVTGSDGRVSTIWTVGTVAGNRVLTAQAAGTSGGEFTVNVLPGPVTGLGVTQGDGQNGVGSLPLDDPIVVPVQDAFGNPVSNVEVTFAVTGGGGSFNPTVATTDEFGNATSTWILGPNLGAQSATVTAAGAPPAALTATATAVVGPPASISAVDESQQVADPGESVEVPAVVVLDAANHPVPNLAVTFTVTGGGGAVTGANAMTDLTGRARPESWTLGPLPGLNTLQATVDGMEPLALTGAVGSAFHIEVRFLTPVSSAQEEAYAKAADRWRRIIIGDLVDTSVSLTAGSCAVGSPAIDEVVDDILILASSVQIDGVGGTLGSAGPCAARPDFVPVTGAMRFDDDDLRALALSDRLDDVILHEMGHVLGIGTIWQDRDLIIGIRGGDPFFTGPEAIAQFFAIGGQAENPVPVENQGGAGTRDSHWRESVFGNEFMTGFVNDVNPVSKVTIASMQDMGYEVNIDGDDGFTLPFGAAVAPQEGERFKLNEVSFSELRRILEAKRAAGRRP